MKTLLAVGACLLLAAVAAPRVAHAWCGQSFSAALDPSNEVPATDSSCTATAHFTFSLDGVVSYTITLDSGCDPADPITAQHLHMGAAGASGPVVVPLKPFVNGVSAGTFTKAALIGPLAGKSLDDLYQAVLDGNIYVNMHTALYKGGAARDQLAPDACP